MLYFFTIFRTCVNVYMGCVYVWVCYGDRLFVFFWFVHFLGCSRIYGLCWGCGGWCVFVGVFFCRVFFTFCVFVLLCVCWVCVFLFCWLFILVVVVVGVVLVGCLFVYFGVCCCFCFFVVF